MSLFRKITNFVNEVRQLRHNRLELIESYATQRKHYEILAAKFEELVKAAEKHQRIMLSRIKEVEPRSSRSTTASKSKSNLFADNHDLDAFYLAFEDAFRGSESTIAGRVKKYNKYLKKISPKSIAVDIGCGRGEFLEALKDKKINHLGVDLNSDMVEVCKKKGLDAVQEDATITLSKLSKDKKTSVGAVTGFHIAEHLPFEPLLELIKNSYYALENGGFLLLETPNPENLQVGTLNFYNDPSHLKPLPPNMLKFLFEYAGFTKVEIVRSSPSKQIEPEKIKDLMTRELVERFYGPQDYAVIGYK